MIVPFLFELRSVIDWTWTDTSMPLFDYLNMENFYATICYLKCMRAYEEVRGEGTHSLPGRANPSRCPARLVPEVQSGNAVDCSDGLPHLVASARLFPHQQIRNGAEAGEGENVHPCRWIPGRFRFFLTEVSRLCTQLKQQGPRLKTSYPWRNTR